MSGLNDQSLPLHTHHLNHHHDSNNNNNESIPNVRSTPDSIDSSQHLHHLYLNGADAGTLNDRGAPLNVKLNQMNDRSGSGNAMNLKQHSNYRL
jgi:hypothetical protein